MAMAKDGKLTKAAEGTMRQRVSVTASAKQKAQRAELLAKFKAKVQGKTNGEA